MDRSATLNSLARFDAPLPALASAVAALDDAGAPMVLTRAHVAAVLHRYLTGTLTAKEVAGWAALVEACAAVEFEPRHEAAVADALFDLANPDEQGALPDVVDDVLALLGH